MSGLATMGDLFARHEARIGATAFAAPPRSRPTPAPGRIEAAPATAPAAARVQRIVRGDGYELRIAGKRVASVMPAGAGFVVTNHGAGHKAILADARLADALAARIARLAAMPMGQGEA